MTWINDGNREMWIKRLASNQKHTHTEEEIRKMVDKDPQILEDFADDYCDKWRTMYE